MTETTDSQAIIAQLEERVQSGQLELPMLSTVATEVLALVDGDDCDARSLADLVQRDASLAAIVLRVSNSARHAPTETIVSLTQAISRLGLSTLREIVITAAVKTAVFNVEGHDEYVARLWLHAHASGRIAQEIARSRRSNVEAAFLCGLLHDIGTPVVLKALTSVCQEAGHLIDEALLLAAEEALHASVGARLVAEWRLPDSVREVALFHHEPERASKHKDLVYTAALADVLSHWISDGDAQGLPPGLEFAEALDLYDDDIEELLAKGADISAESTH